MSVDSVYDWVVKDCVEVCTAEASDESGSIASAISTFGSLVSGVVITSVEIGDLV